MGTLYLCEVTLTALLIDIPIRLKQDQLDPILLAEQTYLQTQMTLT